MLLICFLVNVLSDGRTIGQSNVLIILVDDLKPNLGCYGDPLAKTPNIDRLAASGMRFEMAYCNQSVCAPSRNNLLLGSRSTSIGIYGLGRHFRDVLPNAVTMPQYFSKNGWKSASFGKVLHTGHGNHDDPHSWDVPAYLDKVVEYLLPESTEGGQLTREEAYFTNQKLDRIGSLPKGYAWENADVDDDGYADGRIAEKVIERLQFHQNEPEKPFFIMAGFVKPHLPFTAPKKYWDMHDPNAFPLASDQNDPEAAPGFAGKRGGEIVNYAPLTVANLKETAVQRQLLHGYYAAASFADAQIGKVLDALDRYGFSDNTMVVLWGDHGWHLGDHGCWTKHTNYEQANRIPIIFRVPGMTEPGSVTRQLAETVDIFPTLADLAGLPRPKGPQPIDGTSLVPVLKNSEASVRDHAYHAYPRGPRMGRAIRTDRYRLVEWKRPGADQEEAVFEVYDYQEDPGETRNLAASRPELLAQLKLILANHPEPLERR
ncbi:MAG: sulfatase [Verrucomicrobia bacterium]|nr:sulfatase [Verrucomicrobiota bacterium]